MIRQVRVILSAEVDRFTGGIRNAIGIFTGFVGGVASGARSVVSFLSDIGNIVSGLAHGFNMLAGFARGLWDTFIQGAISEERLGLTMKFMSGSAETAASIMERLDDWIVKTGTDGDDAEEAILDMAKALRATDGAVDPDKLFKTMDILKRLSLATGMSLSEMSKIVGRALTGDVEMLARTLGISKEKLAELSPEFAKFVQNVEGASDTQLGEVTRLGGQTEQIAGDALKALDEVANALGATDAALDEYANSTDGKLLTIQGLWENFTENVGDELLPIIGKALEKIINFVEDHEEDIAKFVDQFGNIATEGFDKLMEWIDSGAAEEMVKQLNSFSAKEWKSLVEFLKSIDWEGIGRVVKGISDAAKAIWSIVGVEKLTPEEAKKQTDLTEKIFGGAFNAAFAPTQKPTESLGTGVTEAFTNLANQISQGLNIKISVDDDGKIQAYTKKVVDATMEEFVTSTTGGNKQHGDQQ